MKYYDIAHSDSLFHPITGLKFNEECSVCEFVVEIPTENVHENTKSDIIENFSAIFPEFTLHKVVEDHHKWTKTNFYYYQVRESAVFETALKNLQDKGYQLPTSLSYDVDKLMFLNVARFHERQVEEQQLRVMAELSDQLIKKLDNLAKVDSSKIVKEIINLIENGANVDSQGKKTGWTAAHMAVHVKSVELIKFLVEKKANLNLQSKIRQHSPIFYSTNREMYEFLIANGADKHLRNKANQTAKEYLLSTGALTKKIKPYSYPSFNYGTDVKAQEADDSLENENRSQLN